MSFKRMMVLGAVASALAFTGCQSRRGNEDTSRSRTTEQTEPATGGSGNVDSTIPGSSNTMGGVRQDERPGTELGGTGSSGGSINDQSNSGSLDQGGTGGSGSLDQDTSGSLNQDTSGSLDQSGTGGSGTKAKTSKKGGKGDGGTPGGTDAGM